jgi:plasmid maintenance system antidote protein VapI
VDLEEYLFRNRIKKSHFAKDLGIAPGHFYAILAKRRRPSVNLALKIAKMTGGKVSKEEILFPEDYQENE